MTLDFTMSWIWHQKNRQQRVGKLDFTKIKNICPSKDTTKRMKRQPRVRNFANHRSDNGLIFKIYKGFLQQKIIKNRQDLNRYFSTDVQTAKTLSITSH